MEFGVGIHGEPGIDRRSFSSLDQTVDEMFDTLLENGSYHALCVSGIINKAVGRKNNKPNNRSSLAIG